jgi:outer membrane protein assembly factor BamB
MKRNRQERAIRLEMIEFAMVTKLKQQDKTSKIRHNSHTSLTRFGVICFSFSPFIVGVHPMRSWLRSAVAVSVCAIILPVLQGNDWPQFRGPNGSGVSESPLPTEWALEKNIKWKASMAGVGWASPVIVGKQVFIATAISEKQVKPTAGGGFGGGAGKGPAGGPPGGGGGFGKAKGAPDVIYQFEIQCLDLETGKMLWKKVALDSKPKIPTHRSNTYASETPVTDGKNLYVYFGMHGVYSYDLTGKLNWKKDLGVYPMQAGWGTSSSPVLEDGKLFIQCDNEEKSFLVALDTKDGSELWRKERSEKSTWSTPLVWKNKKRTELVTLGSTIRSYDPKNGNLLWELLIGQSQASVSPVADEVMLYIGAGMGGGGRFAPKGDAPPTNAGTLFAVKAGATGNISLKSSETSNDGVAWSAAKSGLGMASPLAYQGFVYVFERNGGLVSAFDAKTGKPAYSKERIPSAKAFWASPWAADGKIYAIDEGGTTHVLAAGAEFKVLGKNDVKDMVWSTPATNGEVILLRGVDNLYCITK